MADLPVDPRAKRRAKMDEVVELLNGSETSKPGKAIKITRVGDKLVIRVVPSSEFTISSIE